MNRTAIATAAIVILGSGCYTTTAIPPAQIASIERPLSAPRAVAGAARLGPRSEIRARLTDGTITEWLPAGKLAVGGDGLVTGRGRPLSTATEAAIFGGSDGAAAMLAATAPPGAEVTPLADRLRVRVRDARVLLPWLASYATGATMFHLQPGAFSFRDDTGHWESEPLPGTSFATLSPQRLAQAQVAEGIPWSLVAGLEVHNMDPLRTTGAVIGAPIAMSLMLLAAVGTTAAIANGDDPTPALALGITVAQAMNDAAASADAGADTGGAPVRAPGGRPAVLIAPGGPDATLGVTPLFSPGARRRDAFKLVLAGEAGITSNGTFTGSAGAGFRAGDFLELTARARTLAFDDTSDAVFCGCEAPLPPQHLLFGGRLAFHIDPDGNPLTAFVFGAEILGGLLQGGADLTEMGFVLGPRFGIGEKLFASLLISPSLITWRGLATRNDGTAGQLMLTAELGFDL